MLLVAFGSDILETAVHGASGVATFVIALALLLGLERVLIPRAEVAA